MEKAFRDELRDKDALFRQLHNQIVDLKVRCPSYFPQVQGRIRVSVRVRPLLASECGASMDHLSFPLMTSIQLQQGRSSSRFDFGHVFGPRTSQEDVFNEVKDLVLVRAGRRRARRARCMATTCRSWPTDRRAVGRHTR